MLIHSSNEKEEEEENAVKWNIASIFKGIYNQNFDQWFVFNIGDCQYPDHSLLLLATHVIIPGSSFSAYQTEKWIVQERDWIKNTYQQYQQLKFLLICFGEQMFAESVGGKVEKMAKRNHQFSQIQLNANFFQIPFIEEMFKNKNDKFYQEIQQKQKIKIKQLHGDIVTKLPENCYEVAGSSDGIEIYSDHNNRIFAVQGHPEYNPPWTMLIFPLIYLEDRSLKSIDNQYQQQLQYLENRYKDINMTESIFKDVLFMRYVCKNFLKFRI